MKCPNCGGEAIGKFCEFCGSEMPREKESINITNNYYGDVPLQEENEDATKGCCPKCMSTKISFKRERIGTATQSSSKKNVVGRGSKGKSVSQSAYRTIGLCQNCGFTWNPNVEAAGSADKKQAPIWLWVLGWICIFPVPLTILMLRKKDMKPALKYGIIAAGWIVYLIIGLSGNSNNSTSNTVNTKSDTNIVVENKETETVENSGTEVVNGQEVLQDEKITKEEELSNYIDSLIVDFNVHAEEQLIYVEDFTPSDKDSTHYKTEFRLTTYKDAVGKSYSMGDDVVDIVVIPTYSGDTQSRVYTYTKSLSRVEALIKGFSPLLDTDMKASDLNDAIVKIENDKEANGYYFGDLGLLLLGSDTKGYEFMLKYE